jgi:hypothetical protein
VSTFARVAKPLVDRFVKRCTLVRIEIVVVRSDEVQLGALGQIRRLIDDDSTGTDSGLQRLHAELSVASLLRLALLVLCATSGSSTSCAGGPSSLA